MRKLSIIALGLLLATSVLFRFVQTRSHREEANKIVVIPTRPELATEIGLGDPEITAIPIALEPTVAPPLAEEIELLKSAFENFDTSAELLPNLREKFAEGLRADPAFLTKALDYLSADADPAFMKYMADVIVGSSSSASNLLGQTVMNVVENSASSARRQAALNILRDNFQVSTNLLTSVVHSSRTDADPEVRASAADTLGIWLRSPNGTEGEIIRGLLEIINGSSEEQVQSSGLHALVMQEAVMSLDLLQAMPVPTNSQNRLMAALVLGKAAPEAKDFSVQRLEQIYLGETDADTRSVIASQMIYLAGSEALDRIKQISSNDPLLVQKMEAYLATLGTSATP